VLPEERRMLALLDITLGQYVERAPSAARRQAEEIMPPIPSPAFSHGRLSFFGLSKPQTAQWLQSIPSVPGKFSNRKNIVSLANKANRKDLDLH
jgi:hypothetical protein